VDRLFAPDPDDGAAPDDDAPPADAPLAARLRPRTVEDVVGQPELLGPGRPLRATIESGRPHAMLLHGPPGSGKTTLARIVAAGAGAAVEALQAVDAGKAEVRAALERARARRDPARAEPRPTVLFIDEIHRFNRTQQDALLPAVEEGLVTLIAATTEPPWSAVSPALRSRLRIYRLRALGEADVLTLLQRAIDRRLLEREGEEVRAEPEALALLASRSAGDARTALGALEAAAGLARPSAEATGEGLRLTITAREVSGALDRSVIAAGPDQPHDLLSAYIKSIRGSDPDAAVYYLAGMLAAGEDPRTIARRLVVSASEDVGLADPQALPLAIAAAEVVDRIGMPECRIALSHVTIRLALAGKSSAAYRAINEALDHVEQHGVQAPPPYLRGRLSDGARPQDYDYPHDRPGGYSAQELLPDELAAADHRFLRPAEHEQVLLERLAAARRARGRTP
jgi:putative ATPase